MAARAGNRPGRVRGHAVRLPRATTSEARERRHQWNELDPQESEREEREASPERIVKVRRNGRSLWRVRLGGCWYVTSDGDAGLRAYKKNGKTKRYWFGYYNAKAVDHFTGGVIPLVASASLNESKLFPELYDLARSMIGEAPQTVTGDKGFSVSGALSTRRGTARRPCSRGVAWSATTRTPMIGMACCAASIAAGRRPRSSSPRSRGARACGSAALTARSRRAARSRRRSRATRTGACSCRSPRTELLYQELRASHHAYEGVHDYWRDRYRVAADSRGNRPKAIGIGWHRLRANVACCVDWLRIAAHNGWLGSTRAARRGECVRRCEQDGKNAVSRRKKFRATVGLMSRYGRQAKKLGLGEEPHRPDARAGRHRRLPRRRGSRSSEPQQYRSRPRGSPLGGFRRSWVPSGA